jgi:hypothetical protein
VGMLSLKKHSKNGLKDNRFAQLANKEFEKMMLVADTLASISKWIKLMIIRIFLFYYVDIFSS